MQYDYNGDGMYYTFLQNNKPGLSMYPEQSPKESESKRQNLKKILTHASDKGLLFGNNTGL